MSIGLKGIIGLEYEEILRDVLDNHIINDTVEYDSKIVKTVLPKKQFFPMCRYIYQSGIDIMSEYLVTRLKMCFFKSFEETVSRCILLKEERIYKNNVQKCIRYSRRWGR